MDERSRELRKDIIHIMTSAGRGHLGAAFSVVEILRTLYDHILRYDPSNPKAPDRDRFIFSKGHGCLALYTILADKGFFPKSALKTFCAYDSFLGGHPEPVIPGVEVSTGSLGHGLSIGVGMAINARYEKSDHRVFVVVGDGECDEGSVWEGAMSASKHKLDNLTVLVDYNKHQSYGPTREVMDLEPFMDKWRAFGFAGKEVDGHDVNALREALLSVPYETGKPSVLICHTIKGKGISQTENNLEWHHRNKMSEELVSDLLEALEL